MLGLRCIWIVVALFLALTRGHDDGEQSHSTSVVGMVKLLELESALIENLNEYASELEKKLLAVRSIVDDLRAENVKAIEQTELYLSNPLNSFKLIRRMHRDWTYYQLYMTQPIGEDQVKYLQQRSVELPTSTDLQEAATSMHRIQNTYDIQPADIMRGYLNGKQYDINLTAVDAYAIGLYNYDEGNFASATYWLYEASRWFETHSLPAALAIDRSEVLRVYAEALIKMDDWAKAIQVLDVIIKLKGLDVEILSRKAEIQTLLRTKPNVKPQKYTKPPVTMYEKGCRGQYLNQPKLYCTYNSTTSPFTRLAPIKMELVRLDPYMVLYHDVFSPNETLAMQEMAMPILKRATVYKPDIQRNTVVETRTSKVAWFPDTSNELTLRINRRIEDMTGFDMYGSEMLQMMNYGLGGHYAKHFDFFNMSADSNLTRTNGDRIATVLFYLNDVEQGGATVFPNIGQAVFPQRGTAIMWYNLHDNGLVDSRTLHAACPVLVGSKWVCNKWIRERQQMFRRKCLQRPLNQPPIID